MNRRGFLAALGALPFVRSFARAETPKPAPDRGWYPFVDRPCGFNAALGDPRPCGLAPGEPVGLLHECDHGHSDWSAPERSTEDMIAELDRLLAEEDGVPLEIHRWGCDCFLCGFNRSVRT